MTHQKVGCQTCRLRHLKCDGKKPTCARCAKANRVCIGPVAGTQPPFTVHDESSYASGEVRRRRGPRPSLTLHRPHSDLISTAVVYLLNYHMRGLADSPGISACMSECFIAWQFSNRQSNMVDRAVSSVAVAIFSQTQKHPPAIKAARSLYCQVLHLAQQLIIKRRTKLEEQDVDEYLLIIILMALYESTMHQAVASDSDPLPPSQHSWSHHIGALAVLKMWVDMPGNYVASVIIKQARRGLIRSALLRNCALPGWILDGSRFGEQNFDLEFDAILCQVVNLRYSFKALNKVLLNPEAGHLTIAACSLDEACTAWASRIPRQWAFEVHETSQLKSTAEAFIHSTVVFSFSRRAYAAAWIQYLATHMLIISTRLSLITIQPFNQANESLYLDLYMRMKILAHNIASILPFSLGRFHLEAVESSETLPQSRHITVINKGQLQPSLALPVVWPLVMVSSLEGVDNQFKSWLCSIVGVLASTLGDGALKCFASEPVIHDL